MLDTAGILAVYGTHSLTQMSFEDTLELLCKATRSVSQATVSRATAVKYGIFDCFLKEYNELEGTIHKVTPIKLNLEQDWISGGVSEYNTFKSLIIKVICSQEASFKQIDYSNTLENLDSVPQIEKLAPELVSHKLKTAIFFRDPSEFLYLEGKYSKFEMLRVKQIEKHKKDYEIALIDYMEVFS